MFNEYYINVIYKHAKRRVYELDDGGVKHFRRNIKSSKI